MNQNEKSFIETQFPVSKISKESYKERKAGSSQTLTGLGKWWGRKPLIVVRAALLGLLLPSTDNPQKDREIFLKLLTMDEEGLWRRKNKPIPIEVLYENLTSRERALWFSDISIPDKPELRKELSRQEREELQKIVFSRLSYDQKLQYCQRPEEIDGPSPNAWEDINAHLGTSSYSLPDLVKELGIRRFGHHPRIGDAFCGGGSVPFEAARLGCEAYGSDLNPVAALLSWAACNIIGGGEEVVNQIKKTQDEVYQAVDQQITEWGIEHNQKGWRADAYLYCTETICPECGWKVPLAPSWVIGIKSRCVAQLVENEHLKCFDIQIIENCSPKEMKTAAESGTIKNSSLFCPHCQERTPITMIRGDRRTENGTIYGLRLWENDDLVPRPEDVFQERLYCIRWVETISEKNGKVKTQRHYRAPDEDDLKREEKVLSLLKERFHDWQKLGYIPSKRIEPGYNTDQPIRERGWTHWHHLFNPRQLLILGSLMQEIMKFQNKLIKISLIMWTGKIIERNAKIMGWDQLRETHSHVFTNQALNTYFTVASKSYFSLQSIPFVNNFYSIKAKYAIEPSDCRNLTKKIIFWITDPPYADAINYHELSEFFLAWYEKHLPAIFPDWYTDSKRALAITGREEGFRKSMVDCYRNLANNMPENGMQIVMFTHQDAAVWADLALILWAAGLRVTAAWCIATETDSALKSGNYVQGTVLLVLRKRISQEMVFLDELYPLVEKEVRRQLDQMLALDDQDYPNFGDTDYQLAAYAAALRVLTQYGQIEDLDVMYELSKPREKGTKSPIEKIIDEAVRIACDHLIPTGFDSFVWKTLTPVERFYIKGLDIERHGEYRSGAYQELARGFGIKEYRALLESGKANQTRLKTASEFGAKVLGDSGFGETLVRNTLFAVRETVRSSETSAGRNWLKNELKMRYWEEKKSIIEFLRYLSNLEMNAKMSHWVQDSQAARLLSVVIENDHV